jgi:hypothetical protein
MQQYLAIVNTENNRVAKYMDFGTSQDANAHVSAYGGFVYDNAGNEPLGDLWIDGLTVTVVPPVDEYKAQKLSELEQEALNRANDPFDGNPYGSIGDLELSATMSQSFQNSGTPNQLLVNANDVYVAYVAAKATVDAMTDKTSIVNYDVVNTPAWP